MTIQGDKAAKFTTEYESIIIIIIIIIIMIIIIVIMIIIMIIMIIYRGTERPSLQQNMRALNLVNSSPGITPVWISTNQRIGDYHSYEGDDNDHITEDDD